MILFLISPLYSTQQFIGFLLDCQKLKNAMKSQLLLNFIHWNSSNQRHCHIYLLININWPSLQWAFYNQGCAILLVWPVLISCKFMTKNRVCFLHALCDHLHFYNLKRKTLADSDDPLTSEAIKGYMNIYGHSLVHDGHV